MNGDFRLGAWLVEPSLNTISHNGTSVRLEPKVMEVLVCLAHCPGEPLSKEHILKAVWPETFVSDDVLTRSISELRRVLEDDTKDPRFIQTIPKRGYRLVSPVVSINSAPREAPQVPTSASSKGTQRRWWIYTVILSVISPLGVLAAWKGNDLRRSFSTRNAPISSVAVLPLQNLSGDPQQDYFADAMTEELITELSRISGLKVISRTSVMRYKKTTESIPQIAKELGVSGIVEGSTLRSGERVRITAQLIDALDDRNVWAETYDRDLKDVLAIQAAVAAAIAKEIKVKMTSQEKAQFKQARRVNPQALDAYFAGRYYLKHKSEEVDFMRGQEENEQEERTKALRFFEEAAKQDPDYAPAYLGIADALLSVYVPDSKSVKQARIAVTKAIEIDDSLAEAHFTLAQIRTRFEWDWLGAETELKRVIEVNPNSAAGHDEYGYYWDSMERFDEALKEHQKAQELDPVVDHIGGELYYRWAWNLERDLKVARAGINGSNNALYYRAVEYERLGMKKEALMEWVRVARFFGYDRLADIALHTYSKSGYNAALRALVKALETEPGAEQVFPAFIAHFYGELDDRDRAFAWLEKAYMSHDGDLQFLKVDPFWSNNLRSDPRFADLVHRMRLPE